MVVALAIIIKEYYYRIDIIIRHIVIYIRSKNLVISKLINLCLFNNQSSIQNPIGQ